MLLSNAELKAKLNAAQNQQVIKWLNTRRIPWDRDAKGNPITTLNAIEKYLLKETEEEVSF